jgi:hypothetical protein
VTRADGTVASVSQGTVLQQGDEIKTGPGSKLDLRLGESVIEMAENSSFVLTSETENGATITQPLGYIRYTLKRLLGSRYQVRTPTACACVRGTQFAVSVRANGWTQITVVEGLVDFVNLAAPSKHVLVKAGYTSTIAGSKSAPTKPKRG